MDIRPAVPSDAPAICALEREVWGEAVTSLPDMLSTIREGWAFVAESGGIIVGAVLACATRRAEAHVVDVAVQPAWRRCGAGLALYKRLLAEPDVGERVVVALVAPDNAASITLHDRLGFTRRGVVADAHSVGSAALRFVRLPPVRRIHVAEPGGEGTVPVPEVHAARAL